MFTKTSNTVRSTRLWRAGLAAALSLLLPVALAGPAVAQQVQIGSGHVDVLAFAYDSGAQELDIIVDDDTVSPSQPRDPADVTFVVHDGHRTTLSQAMPCVGGPGDVWLLPRQSTSGLLWAGWNTDRVQLSQFGGSLQASLVNVAGPAGGSVSVFDPGSGGTPDIRFHSDPACDGGGTDITESHHHPSWVFTAPGTYRLTFQVSGQHQSAGSVASPQITYTFVVG